jgi:hypothetical protein
MTGLRPVHTGSALLPRAFLLLRSRSIEPFAWSTLASAAPARYCIARCPLVPARPHCTPASLFSSIPSPVVASSLPRAARSLLVSHTPPPYPRAAVALLCHVLACPRLPSSCSSVSLACAPYRACARVAAPARLPSPCVALRRRSSCYDRPTGRLYWPNLFPARK